MKRPIVLKYCATALLFTILAVAPAYAAFEGVVQAYQPIVTHMGIFLSPVTSVRYSGSRDRSESIAQTCKPNNVSTQEEYQNRNIASLIGIKVTVDHNPEWPWDLFGDTVRVIVSADSMKADKSWPFVDPDTALTATIECILANASAEMDIKYVVIDVYRKPNVKPLHQVYDLRTFRSYPRRRHYPE